MHLKKENLKRFCRRWLPTVIGTTVLFITACVLQRTPIPKINPRNGVFYEKAVVTQILEEQLETDGFSGSQTGKQQVLVTIKSGHFKGESFPVTNYANYSDNVVCQVGTRLIVSVTVSSQSTTASIYTYDRTLPLIGLFAVFCLVLCLVGGKKGLKALFSLAFTFFCILFLFIPLLYRGISPVPAAIGLSAVVSTSILTWIDGWNTKSAAAIISTVVCVSLAGAFSSVAGAISHISTFNMDAMDQLIVVCRQSDLQIKGLSFAVILLACLGAVVDMSMSISSSLHEIYLHTPQLSRLALFKSGMRVGRDMMGTMASTLLLAFTAGYLSTMILLFSYDVTLYEIFSMPSVVSEIIQGLAGSIGVFLNVPVTSYVTAYLLTRHHKTASSAI